MYNDRRYDFFFRFNLERIKHVLLYTNEERTQRSPVLDTTLISVSVALLQHGDRSFDVTKRLGGIRLSQKFGSFSSYAELKTFAEKKNPPAVVNVK